MTPAGVGVMVFLAVLAAELLLTAAPRGLPARLGRATGAPQLLPRARAWVALRSWRDRRASEAQLAHLAELLAQTAGVGMTIPAALEHAARQLSGPLRREVERVLGEYHLGISLSGALRSWKQRAGSRDVDLLVETLELVRQVGGSVSAPLAQVASTLQRRRRGRQDAWTQMAEARLSAAVVAAIPPLVAALMARSQSEAWQVVTQTAVGRLALGVAVVCWLAGMAITLYLLRPPQL